MLRAQSMVWHFVRHPLCVTESRIIDNTVYDLRLTQTNVKIVQQKRIIF